MLEDTLSDSVIIYSLETNLTIDEVKKQINTIVVERYIQLIRCKYIGEIGSYATGQDLGGKYVDKDFTQRVYCEKNGVFIL